MNLYKVATDPVWQKSFAENMTWEEAGDLDMEESELGQEGDMDLHHQKFRLL